MGFFDRVFKQKKVETEGEKYIDLSEWAEMGKVEGEAKMHVRVAEIYRYEDLGNLTAPVYDGDLILLDFSPIAGDDFTLRRIMSELKQLTADIGGDLVGIGRNMLVVAPSGTKIDRERFRPTI